MRLPYLILLVLSGLAYAISPRTSLKITASDFIPNKYWQSAQAHAQAQSIDLDIEALGSCLALRSLEKNTTDIAIIAKPLQQPPIGSTWKVTTLACKVLTVIVHKDNPIKEISFKQLENIYGSYGEHGPKVCWGALGLRQPWDSPTIQAFLPKTSAESLTVELFQSCVLTHSYIHGAIYRMDSKAQIIQAVAANPYAIGIIEGICTDPGVKTLAVAPSTHSSIPALAFLPTSEAVHQGDYPLRLPFVIVNAQNPTLQVQRALAILGSSSCKQALEQASFVIH